MTVQTGQLRCKQAHGLLKSQGIRLKDSLFVSKCQIRRLHSREIPQNAHSLQPLFAGQPELELDETSFAARKVLPIYCWSVTTNKSSYLICPLWKLFQPVGSTLLKTSANKVLVCFPDDNGNAFTPKAHKHQTFDYDCALLAQVLGL